jgi:replicative DNA helicase
MADKGWGARMITDAEAQQKLLNIVANKQEFIPDFLSEQIGIEYFDAKYRPFVRGIEQSYQDSQAFTEEYYNDFISKSVANGDYNKWTGSEVSSQKIAVGNEKDIYTGIKNFEKTDSTDFSLMCRRVRESFIRQRSVKLIERFSANKGKDWMGSLSSLTEELTILTSNSIDGKIASWDTVAEYGDDWYAELENEITNPKKVLQTGIKPFDETMPMGLDIGALTLIVADVGGFKSATMINIALNVCKDSQEDVLYVSLEMPKARLMQRIMAREANVHSEKIGKPSLLSPPEKERLKKASDEFKKISSKFAILDAQERMTVSKIRAELEKRKHFFKPRLVVIDYISILSPEPWYQRLAEHSWYGQMCKDLRQLGRKMGFSVLSAVQLNREAIKSLRNQKDGKQTVGSDALRGSHDFSADADNIFVQFPHPDRPKEKLYLVCVKSRYGSTMFGQYKDKSKADLEVNPHIGKIYSTVEATFDFGDPEASDLIKKAEDAVIKNPDLDLSFEPEAPNPMLSKGDVKKTIKGLVNNVNDLGFD